jgi:hypothetical protein
MSDEELGRTLGQQQQQRLAFEDSELSLPL